MNKEQQKYEDMIMAHRYLYYVLSEPVYADSVYDQLEREAREILEGVDSPVHGVGSCRPESYSAEQVRMAKNLLNNQY